MILSFLFVFFTFSWAKNFVETWVLRLFGNPLVNWLSSFTAIQNVMKSALDFFSFGMTLIAFTFIFSWVFILISIPFSDPLAEETEKILGIHPSIRNPEERSVSFFKMLVIDFMKTLFVIFLQIGVLMTTLLFFWMPGVQIIAFIINAWLLAFQFLSYPQTRRGLGVFQSFKILGGRPMIVWTFGAVASAFYFVPYVSAFLTPLAVVAGTVLYARLESAQPRRVTSTVVSNRSQ